MEEYDRPRLGEIAEGLKGIPALRISAAAVERDVEANRQVAASTFRANVFGRATLEAEYRKPIAMVAGDPPLGLDETGVVFPLHTAERPLLVVERNEHLFGPILSITDSGRLRSVAELAKNLQLNLPKLAGNIALDRRGGLSLRVGGATEVVFGGGDRLADKVRVLAKALSDEPNLLQAYSLNLVDPARPTREKAN